MPFDIADNITPRYVILEICYPVVHLDLISVITPRSWRNSSIGRGKSAVRYKRAIKVYHKMTMTHRALYSLHREGSLRRVE